MKQNSQQQPETPENTPTPQEQDDKNILIGFYPTPENKEYIDKLFNGTKSDFINKAIENQLLLMNRPKVILLQLKERYPHLFKYVQRYNTKNNRQ